MHKTVLGMPGAGMYQQRRRGPSKVISLWEHIFSPVGPTSLDSPVGPITAINCSGSTASLLAIDLHEQPRSAVHLCESPAPCAPRDVAKQEQQHEKSFELILNGRWLFNWRWVGRRPVVRRRLFNRRQMC